MSTPELTLIAGATAMPRVRPLEMVSRSIGLEWSLLPPNISFRAELKVLYTAMLRTFCVNAAAIFSMCRWDPQTLHRQPAALLRGAVPLDFLQPTRAPERTNSQWNAIAGVACAFGGAAAIAWLARSQQPQTPTPTLAAAPTATLNAHAAHVDANPAASQARSAEAQAPIAWNRARGDLRARASEATAAAPAAEKPDVSTSPAANAGRFAPGNAAVSERAFAVARRAVDAHASVPPGAADPFALDASRQHSTKRERDAITRTGTHRAPHPAVRSLDAGPRDSWRSQSDAYRYPTHGSLHRVHPRPSMAGAYSPFAPSPRANSDYASVSLSAGMRDIAPGSIARGHVDTNSTEWMNDMSQRRVTEIPDRFSN